MRVTKGIKDHLSKDKDNKQQQFQKSTRQRVRSKNLYTLNKQSQEESQSQTYQIGKKFNQSKRYHQSHEAQYQDQYSQIYEDNEDQNQPNQPRNVKLAERDQPRITSSDESSQDEQNGSKSKQGRIKKHLPAIQNQEEALQLHLRIKHLEQQNQLLNHSLGTHQYRQKQMVGKFAKLEAQNKRLEYNLTKILKSDKEKAAQSKKMHKLREQTQLAKRSNQQILGFVQNQNIRIITYLQGLIKKLVSQTTCRQQPSKNEGQSLASYLQKCLSSLKQSRKTVYKQLSPPLDQSKQNVLLNQQQHAEKQSACFQSIFAYQAQRIAQLSDQNQRLNAQIAKLKQQFLKLSQGYKKLQIQKQNTFKQEKTQLCEKYNQVFEEVKNRSKGLEVRIQQQEQKYETKRTELEKTIQQKQRVIKKLKQQLKCMNEKLGQFEEERLQLFRNSMSRKQQPYYSKKTLMDGDLLNQTLNSNKQHSYNSFKQHPHSSFKQHPHGSFKQHLHQQHSHQQSIYEYQPQRKKKKIQQDIDNIRMRKSHRNRKATDISFEKQEHDLKKIDKQIQDLERQIIMEFQNQK